jgi:hypothetical protein
MSGLCGSIDDYHVLASAWLPIMQLAQLDYFHRKNRVLRCRDIWCGLRCLIHTCVSSTIWVS